MATFPSFQKIVNETQKTILRFPLEILAAIVGTFFAIYAIEENDRDTQRIFVKIIMSCSLCLVLFLSISLYFLRDTKNNILRFTSSLVSSGLTFAFIFQFADSIKTFEAFQFVALSLTLHLLVSFAPFINKKYNEAAFWEFNKQLFLRILTSSLYSIFIYAGLSFALLATQNLFGIEYYNSIYLHLFYFVFGIFNTIFFLAGVPETNNEELSLKYPLALKKFTQFVLIPLINIYLVILLSYEIKIIALFSLPVGWVSNLILVFAIFGILSLLLIHPIANNQDNLWMQKFYKWFYYLLAPLLGLLFWAILYRINLYGVTHERYYVLALSLWLTIVTAYFIISKSAQIKFIPISMSIIAFLTIIGPQSANSISKWSQLNRFKNYVSNTKAELTIEQERDLSSIVHFIRDNYGVEALLPYSAKLVQLYKKDKDPYDSTIVETLGFTYHGTYTVDEEDNKYFTYNYYSHNGIEVEKIQGYDFSFEINDNYQSKCENCISLNDIPYSINYNKTEYGMELIINDEIIPIRINDFVTKNKKLLNNNNQIIKQQITTGRYDILLKYESLNGEFVGDKIKLNWYTANILLKVK
ncbi:DUF4153 domain-containing protein [Flavobacterium algicola]|uniref:DUF4153 domain-containing protein n=1 Tax=Flavobacterium algicola TaxID=556529 RepID=UPI001EFECBD1|nr:DUF4153 domain-containing protein [Flavobacterium algicola]MCG9794168.1 DUF4153 domain-containing protein [Flavobacterium algicola]